MLVFSPLIFVFAYICIFFGYLKKRFEHACQESFQRQVRELKALYKLNPREALRDYYEHISSYRHDIPQKERARDYLLVATALSELAEEFEVYSKIEVLVKLGIISEPYDSCVLEVLGSWSSTVPQWRAEARKVLNIFFPVLLIVGGLSLVFSPAIIVAPEAALFFFACWFTIITCMVIYRVEGHIVLYNMYRAVKDRTCPLIIWS
jgi:hypothetical protein